MSIKYAYAVQGSEDGLLAAFTSAPKAVKFAREYVLQSGSNEGNEAPRLTQTPFRYCHELSMWFTATVTVEGFDTNVSAKVTKLPLE